MRRPHRNIEIFSMSVLDMFASALGAFIMCSIILFPYYKKDVSQELAAATAALVQKKSDLESATEQLRQTQEQVRRQESQVQQARQAQADLSQCRQGLNKCQADLAKTFLLVQIEWGAAVDVDLHVTDPGGNEFFWAKTNRNGRDFPNSKAQLSIDVAGGAGIEVWVDPAASPGAYQLDYVVRRNPHPEVSVKGAIFDRYGRKPLDAKTIRSGEARIRAGTVQIAADGTVTVR
jgi:hypothetical protein